MDTTTTTASEDNLRPMGSVLEETGALNFMHEGLPSQEAVAVTYRRSSLAYGAKALNKGFTNPIHGLQSQFTQHLSHSGMYRNTSLNTTAPRERYIENSKDWTLKC
eukprot:GILJ01002224.1.p1 GENE.GILJ01002224.1~~GILJ01002224.1.p1  ORF type:complete len:106 (+),score=9.98 GILJ01002224.1:142-459(+)